MCSLRLDVLDKKKESLGEVIKLTPKGRLTSKSEKNPVISENPADPWYFTHT